MTNIKILLAATAAFSLFLCLESNAGTLNRSTSVFSEPSDASTQLTILKASTKVHITGDQQTAAGTTYVPVEIDKIKGWIAKSAVDLEQGDFEYYPVSKRQRIVDLWFSGGFADVISNGSNAGGRIALGLDIFPTDDRIFFFGGFFSKPLSDERMGGNYSGDLHRSNFLFDLGYFFIPEAFYVRGMIGFSVVNSSNFEIGTKLEPTFGGGLGYQFYRGASSSLALEATYEYTERGVSSAFGLDTGIDQAFGDFDVSTIIPHASVIALNLVFNFTP